MLTESIGRRYAKALFDAAAAQKAVDTIGHELSAFVKTLDKEKGLRGLWFSGRLPEGEMKDFLQRLFPEFSGLLMNFLRLLVDKRREKLIVSAAVEYEKLLLEFYNQAFVEVRVASPMPESIEAELRQNLSKKLGKRVDLMITEDASLVGGMILQIGDCIYDGSVRAKLEKLRQELLDAPLPA